MPIETLDDSPRIEDSVSFGAVGAEKVTSDWMFVNVNSQTEVWLLPRLCSDFALS